MHSEAWEPSIGGPLSQNLAAIGVPLDGADRFVPDVDPPPAPHRFWGLVAMSVSVLEDAVWQTMGEAEAEQAMRRWAAAAEGWLTEGTEGR
jgi:hypothetical protein